MLMDAVVWSCGGCAGIMGREGGRLLGAIHKMQINFCLKVLGASYALLDSAGGIQSSIRQGWAYNSAGLQGKFLSELVKTPWLAAELCSWSLNFSLESVNSQSRTAVFLGCDWVQGLAGGLEQFQEGWGCQKLALVMQDASDLDECAR